MPDDRMQWMDLLRGIAIILVAFNHGVLFATISGDSAPNWLVTVNDMVAPVRMPLMVFLSGMLLPKSLSKGMRAYLGGKARGIAYPYVVWSLVVLAIDSAIKHVRDGGPFIDPLAMLYAPYAHLWFLHYLFIFYIIGLILLKVPATIVSGASLAATFLVPDSFQRFFVLLVFFMLGRLAAEKGADIRALMAKKSTGVVGALVGSLLIVLAVVGEPVRYQPLYSPIVMGAVVFFIWMSMRIQDKAGTSTLRYIGRNSLVFYLVHWYPMLFGIEIGVALAPDLGWLAVLLGTAAGIASGFLAAWFITLRPALNIFFGLRPTKAPQRQRLT